MYIINNIELLITESKNSSLIIIIKGNMDRLLTESIRKIADNFYNNIKQQLENKHYQVEFDAGLPYTLPNTNAFMWLAHSRGVDRLRFAPKHIITRELFCKSNLKNKDDNANNPLHYQLSDDDKEFLNKIPPLVKTNSGI